MDYEKKYNFLELAGSKDERIRKALLEMVHDTTGDELWVDYNVHKEEALSWLEKQESVNEIVSRCRTSWYNEGKIAGMAEGLTDDEKYQQGWHDALEKQGEQKPNPCDECINVKGCINCENGELRETEQKPAVKMKTPEESLGINSDIYNEIVDKCIYGEQKSQRMISAEAKEAMYDKPAWSKEDEKMVDNILTPLATRYPFDIYQPMYNWLKSLKQRIG